MADSELEELAIVAAAAIVLKQKNRKLHRRSPRCHINPYLKLRSTKGRFVSDFSDMQNHQATFRENFHLSPSDFDYLLSLVEPKLRPKVRARGDAFSASEQLAITLEFLASGSYQRHVASVYRSSKQSVGKIIQKTCIALFESLKPLHLPDKTSDDWLNVANKFNSAWNFPNCLGAIDGKHVQITSPTNSGSVFHNYKGFFSIVLMAVGDADYKFTYLDIGAYGSENDSTIFRQSSFGKALAKEQLKLPPDTNIANHTTPFFFVADDAFPLHRRILKPYCPTKNVQLTDSEAIFNYRLSRARRCIENSFGILCSRWRVLARSLQMTPDKVRHVIAACCLLHNYLMQESKPAYCPDGYCDCFGDDGELRPGSWRSNLPANSCYENQFSPNVPGRNRDDAKLVRDHVKLYVNSEEGALPWQNLRVLGLVDE